MQKIQNPIEIHGIFTPETKNDIPENPGVYLYKDQAGKILYIGKAKNLRKRVASYFIKNPVFLKTHLLVQQIHTIDIIIVNNESEALFLEATLIKKYLPKFNINFKDGKFYPYIKITIAEQFPRIFITRNKYDDDNLYFGPYISAGSVRATLEILQKMFKLRTCRTLPKKECLEYHMNRCSAPCIHKISQQEYIQSLQQAINFLSGGKEELIQELQEKMQQASKEMLFEKAQIYKEQLEALYSLDQKQQVYLSSEKDIDIIGIDERMGNFSIVVSLVRQGKLSGKEGFIVKHQKDSSFTVLDVLDEFIRNKYSHNPSIPHQILINREYDAICTSLKHWFEDEGLDIQSIHDDQSQEYALLNLAEKNARIHLEQTLSEPDILHTLHQLQQELHLKNFPSIIEGFDIAKLDGTLASGVMVQFQGGEPNKKAYRLFNIKAENQQDDYIAIEETIYRHYKKLIEEKQQLPQLIIIDGGKGQLSSALKSLKKLKINTIDILSIAKQEEVIFTPNHKQGISLEKNSAVLHLIQRIRDESHRFSQYQLHRRMNKKMKS
ncbi:MAG: excinuclease ABC subunit UvrC [Brevinema sp.]